MKSSITKYMALATCLAVSLIALNLAGAAPAGSEGKKPLHIAAGQGKLDEVKRLATWEQLRNLIIRFTSGRGPSSREKYNSDDQLFERFELELFYMFGPGFKNKTTKYPEEKLANFIEEFILKQYSDNPPQRGFPSDWRASLINWIKLWQDSFAQKA